MRFVVPVRRWLAATVLHHRVGALGMMAALIGLTGSCAAVARLDARLRNPNGIPISHPARQPVADGSFEFFTSRSPDGRFQTVLRQAREASYGQTLQVVDSASGAVVGRLPSSDTAGTLGELGWREPTTLWVSAVEYPATCVAAYVASPPDWEFMLDDCTRRPADAGSTRLNRRAPSPDGAIVAVARFDRLGPSDFGDAASQVPDVRITDRGGRFLAQLGNLSLVGWTMDGSLVVVPDSDFRPHAITRAEIDRIVAREAARAEA